MTDLYTQLNTQLVTLNTQLNAQHPNLCTKCRGVGGKFQTSGDGWNEPREEEFDDCPSCLSRGLHPLDTNITISDEEAEAHINMMWENTHPILSQINDLQEGIEDLLDHLAEQEG